MVRLSTLEFLTSFGYIVVTSGMAHPQAPTGTDSLKEGLREGNVKRRKVMNKYKTFLYSLVLAVTVGAASPASAAVVWVENNFPPDPTGDLIAVVIMSVNGTYRGKEITPGETIKLNDANARNVERFVVSQGTYEYHVKCPKDKDLKITLKFTDIRDNKLPKGFSVSTEADEL